MTGLAGATKYNGLGAGLLVAFFGASPYILIDWPRFVTDVREVQSTMANGPGGIVRGRGWT